MRKLIPFALLLLAALAVLAGPAPTSGSKTCPSSGNVPITTTSVKAAYWVIQAPITNTGNICWGTATVTTSNAPCLTAGQSFYAGTQANSQPYDLSHVSIACTVNTDVVKYTFQ